jgi:hypothetical protein
MSSIGPPSGHIFHVHPTISVVPGGVEREPNMAFGEARYTAENDQPLDTEVEGEIREFVRREVAPTPGRQPDNESELVASNLNSLLQRATGTSVQEIDRMITELQMLRDTLQREAARVQSEIVEYATLSQAAMHSTKIIGESLTPLKKGAPTPSG